MSQGFHEGTDKFKVVIDDVDSMRVGRDMDTGRLSVAGALQSQHDDYRAHHGAPSDSLGQHHSVVKPDSSPET